MAKPTLLQDDFSLGMKHDLPREQLPKGSVWALTDWLVKNDAPLQRRGAWSLQNVPSATSTTAHYMAGVGFAQFTAGSKVVSFDDAGVLWAASVTSASSSSVGAAFVPAAPPVFYRQKLYVPDVNASAVPKVYDGSTVAAMTASAPSAALGCVYKDHLVLARSTANTNRMWFSSGGDPTGWVTSASGQYLDTTYPIQGLGALRNMIIVFSEGYTERVRGDIIPGVSGSDFVKEPLFPVGCSDPASICVTDDYVVFANASGIYLTDGSSIADLTDQSSNKQYWQELMASYAAAWTIAGAVYNGQYVFSVMNGATLITCGVLDIRRRVFTQLSNVKATMMVATPTGILDAPAALFFAVRDSSVSTRPVGNATTMWTQAGNSAYRQDYVGTGPAPVVETAYYQGREGLKRWKNLYVRYLQTDAATDNPLLRAYFQTDPASTSYSTLNQAYPENTATSLVRLPIAAGGNAYGGQRSNGIAFKLVGESYSGDLRINSLQAEIEIQEPSKQS